jgi:hypothetical protein
MAARGPDCKYDEIEQEIFDRVKYLIRYLPSILRIQQSYRLNRDRPYSLFVFKMCHDDMGPHEIFNDDCCENNNCSKWCRKHRLVFKTIRKWKIIAKL